MSDLKTFPTSDMKRTAQEIRALLDMQWSKHMQYYKTSAHSFTDLVAAISSGLPAGQRRAAQDQIEQWHQRMQKQYASLYALADALEQGSINATITDEDISNLFKGFE